MSKIKQPGTGKSGGKSGKHELPNNRHELFAQLVGYKQLTPGQAYRLAAKLADDKRKSMTVSQANNNGYVWLGKPGMMARIKFLENKWVQDALKKIDDSLPTRNEVARNARYAITRAMQIDNLAALNANNRTLGEAGGVFRIQVDNRVMVIDERYDTSEYDDLPEDGRRDADDEDEVET